MTDKKDDRYISKPKMKGEKVRKKCLWCRKEFIADHSKIFMCKPCKDKI